MKIRLIATSAVLALSLTSIHAQTASQGMKNAGLAHQICRKGRRQWHLHGLQEGLSLYEARHEEGLQQDQSKGRRQPEYEVAQFQA